MRNRFNIENEDAIICYKCEHEHIDLNKRRGQKYAKVCSKCGATNIENRILSQKIRIAVLKSYGKR